MKKLRVKQFATAIVISTLGGASSAGFAADPQEGEVLVRQWCESCHLAGNTNRASDVGPPFGQIANNPAYTNARLRAWLHDPHPPMPKFEIDRRTIDNIIAYIRTLKN